MSTPDLDRFWLLDRLASYRLSPATLMGPDMALALNCHEPPSGQAAIPTIAAAAWRDDLIDVRVDAQEVRLLSVCDVHRVFETRSRALHIGLTARGGALWWSGPRVLGIDSRPCVDLAGRVQGPVPDLGGALIVDALGGNGMVQLRVRTAAGQDGLLVLSGLNRAVVYNVRRALVGRNAGVLRFRVWSEVVELQLALDWSDGLQVFERLWLRASARWMVNEGA